MKRNQIDLYLTTSADPVKLGIFTDIQYAARADKKVKFMGKTPTRYFSHVLSKLRTAVMFFNEREVPSVIHLGDIIHGQKEDDGRKALLDLKTVQLELGKLKAPIIHVVGNHCFKAGGRERLLEALNINPSETYRCVLLSPKWQMIILDSLALSLANPSGSALYDEAVKFSEKHAGKYDAHYFKQGGLGAIQTEWLRQQLTVARSKEVNVIVCLHHPVSYNTCIPNQAIWNDAELHELISAYSGTVRAVFSGHFHQGGYSFENGVHYVVFESILDSKHASGSHGVVTLHDDPVCIEIEGHGDMTSRTLKF